MRQSIRVLSKTATIVGLGFTILATGCGKQVEKPSLALLTVEDRANIVTAPAQAELLMRARRLRANAKANVAILTIKHLKSTEPSGFADDAFAAAPFFGVLGGTEVGDKKGADAIREEWSKRGILVCAVASPQMVFVRVGSDFRSLLNDSELHDLMENYVYPNLLKNYFRGGTLSALAAIESKVLDNPARVKEPGQVRGAVDKVLVTLRNYSFPTWRAYYYITLKPLLNSLVLTMKLTGYSIWGVVLWLLILHVITKHDLLKMVCDRLNWSLIKRTGLLKWWLLLGQGHGKEPRGGITIEKPGKKKKVVLKLNVTQRHVTVVQDRMAALDRNIPFVSNVEAQLLKLGLGLPVWACLSLITLPFWENILTMRNHWQGGFKMTCRPIVCLFYRMDYSGGISPLRPLASFLD